MEMKEASSGDCDDNTVPFLLGERRSDGSTHYYEPLRAPSSLQRADKSANGSRANNHPQPRIYCFWLANYLGDAYKKSSMAATSALTSSGLLMEVVSCQLSEMPSPNPDTNHLEQHPFRNF